MARPKSPYALYKRPAKKNKHIYYVRFRDPVTGKYKTAISTGCTRRDKAVLWADKYLRTKTEKSKNITFSEYVKGFWNLSGAYAQGKIVRGYTISKGYLDIAQGNTKNHLLPVWGEYRLYDLTPGKIDKWVIRLKKELSLSPATINKLLQTLRTILDQATADSLINENPAKYIKPLKVVYKKRGIFTPSELMRLFKTPAVWCDFRHYALNLLVSVTAMRMGEIRGLTVDCVHKDYIEIRFSWEQKYGTKEPKFGSVRDIPITPFVFNVLDRIIFETKPQNILFYSDTGKDRPLSKSVIEKQFYNALEQIGISRTEQIKRNLKFHSYRHTLNTILRSRGVIDSKIRMITGHKNFLKKSQYNF